MDIKGVEGLYLNSDNESQHYNSHYQSGIRINNAYPLNLTLGNNSPINGITPDWGGYQHILGDQYIKLDGETDGYGNAWLTFDTVFFEGGESCIGGFDLDFDRISCWTDYS